MNYPIIKGLQFLVPAIAFTVIDGDFDDHSPASKSETIFRSFEKDIFDRLREVEINFSPDQIQRPISFLITPFLFEIN